MDAIKPPVDIPKMVVNIREKIETAQLYPFYFLPKDQFEIATEIAKKYKYLNLLKWVNYGIIVLTYIPFVIKIKPSDRARIRELILIVNSGLKEYIKRANQ